MAHRTPILYVAFFILIILQGRTLAARHTVEAPLQYAPQLLSQERSYVATTTLSGAPAQGISTGPAPAPAPMADLPAAKSLGGQSNNTVDPAFVAAVSAALSTIQHRINARMDEADRTIAYYFWLNYGITMFVFVFLSVIMVKLVVSAPQISRWYHYWRAKQVSPDPASKA